MPPTQRVLLQCPALVADPDVDNIADTDVNNIATMDLVDNIADTDVAIIADTDRVDNIVTYVNSIAESRKPHVRSVSS